MGAGVLTLNTAQHTDGLPGRCTGVKQRLALLPPRYAGAWGGRGRLSLPLLQQPLDSPYPEFSRDGMVVNRNF